MAKLSATERQEQIVTLLTENGTMKITDLAQRFEVSRETIRRDLNALHETGSIKKWFGGAILKQDFRVDRVETRLGEHAAEKQRICAKAMEFIPDESVIFLDTGSTCLCLAKLLKDQRGHTIITNSLPIIHELMDSNHRLIVAGGDYNATLMGMVGMQTVNFLESIKFGVAFLGSSGFDQHQGPAGNRFEDSQIKTTVIKNAQTGIVLCDSSKATCTALTQYASWRDIDYMITDKGISEDTLARLEEMTTVVVT